jgi:Lrp/AsnC family transcriptional regulator, leucine-responsive regulatory protein
MKKNPRLELDALDRKILARYQADARLAAEAIGAEVGLSTAAVHRRLKRLRDGGVIEAEVAVLDPGALGYPLTCLVTVDVDRESIADIDAFSARMRACPPVQQCYYVTGASDFVLVVLAEDMASYEAFTRAHLASDPNVRSFTTHVVLQRVKTGLAVPVSDQG